MAIKDTAAGIGRILKAPPEIWGMRLSLLAAACYMLVKSGAPITGYEMIVAGLGLGAAALVFEYVGATNMARAWFERRPFALLGYALLWAGAFTYSANNWLGAASDGEARKSNIQKAAYVSYSDTRTGIEAARKRVAADEKTVSQLEERAWQELPKVSGKPVSSPEAAKTIMDAAKEGSTRWTQAKVAFEDLTERAKWQKDLADAKVQLADARKELAAAVAKAGSVKTETTQDRSDLHFYKAYFGMDETTAIDLQAALRIGVVSLFVSLFAWLHIADDYKGKPRPPWINWRGMITRARRLWDGTDHTVVQNKMFTTHTIRTNAGLAPASFEVKPA